MEDTGEDADARLPRVVLSHQHRGCERGVRQGNEQPKSQKNKRAYILVGEDASGDSEEAGISGVGFRCRP
jgi:hypothetical protein